ncbi:MAG: alpha/beta fold hydrolase [Anaerolineae bacterium]|nr:alpha/beta fold hydrolase [Anaerolineae bacterium]
MLRVIVLVLVMALAAMTPLQAVAQDGAYQDPEGRFTAPIPEGWRDESTDAYGHFAGGEPEADIYVLAVEADDVQAGIGAALSLIDPDFAVEPVQTVDAPLPNGTWTQNLYAVASGEIVAALGQVQGGVTCVAVLRGAPAAAQAANSTFLGVLTGIAFAGVEAVSPPYVDMDAFEEREITFGLEGWELPGTLTLPVGAGPFPAVVLVHGSGPNDRDETLGPNQPFRNLAWGLASNGVAVLRYDKRTRVYTEELAEMGDLTLDDETVDDALAAVEFLRGVEDIDPARIFVLGHSLGGHAAPRIGARDPDIAGLIILAGFTRPFEDIILEQSNYTAEVDGEVSAVEAARIEAIEAEVARIKALTPESDAGGLLLGAPAAYWLDLAAHDPVATAQTLTMPMLILQGERDYQVTMADFQNWQDGLGDRDNVTLASYPALNHLFIAGEGVITPEEYAVPGFVAEEVVTEIAAWVLAQ